MGQHQQENIPYHTIRHVAKLYTKCLSASRVRTAWKNAKMVIIFKMGNTKDLKNYIPVCLLDLTRFYKIAT